MLTILGWIVGAGSFIGLVVLWISKYFTNASNLTQAIQVTDVADARIKALEAQAAAEHKLRMSELQNEATKVIAANDAAGAIDLLRRHFPSSVNPTNGSQVPGGAVAPSPGPKP